MSNRLYKLLEVASVFTTPSKGDLFDRYAKKEGWVKDANGCYNSDRPITWVTDLFVKDGKLLICFNIVKCDFLLFTSKLRSLIGSPREVGGNFVCQGQFIENLEGAPEKVGGNFTLLQRYKKFTEEQVRAVCNVKGEVHV
jgi:hypothetical protein